MQAEELTITVQDGIIVVQVTCAVLGEQHSIAIFPRLLAVADRTPSAPVVLNLAGVGVMPSEAIGALITLWKKLEDRQQRLILAGLQAPVRNTLILCRLDKFLEFSDSVEEAKRRLSPPAV